MKRCREKADYYQWGEKKTAKGMSGGPRQNKKTDEESDKKWSLRTVTGLGEGSKTRKKKKNN